MTPENNGSLMSGIKLSFYSFLLHKHEIPLISSENDNSLTMKTLIDYS